MSFASRTRLEVTPPPSLPPSPPPPLPPYPSPPLHLSPLHLSPALLSARSGYTAMDWALRNRNRAAVQLLRAHGVRCCVQA
jgi:hypothetical protein